MQQVWLWEQGLACWGGGCRSRPGDRLSRQNGQASGREWELETTSRILATAPSQTQVPSAGSGRARGTRACEA